MNRLQRGFTLIEVMTVVVIIAVLAAIALASVQEYSIRTKVSEGILAMSACRTTVSEIYQGAGSTAPGANGWGCEAGASAGLNDLRQLVGVPHQFFKRCAALLGGAQVDIGARRVRRERCLCSAQVRSRCARIGAGAGGRCLDARKKRDLP